VTPPPTNTVTTAEPSTGSPSVAGSPTAAVGSPAASKPTDPAVTPSPGTTLAAPGTADGGILVISNSKGDGFAVINDLTGKGPGGADESTIATYDAAGNQLSMLPTGSFTGDCGAADVVNTVGRLIITMLITTKPAQGITPASYSLTMTARDAATGAPIWATTLARQQTQQITCTADSPGGGSAADGDLYNFTATLNGRWGVIQPPDQQVSFNAIDLTTGKVYSRPDLEGVIGNYLVTGSGSPSGENLPAHLTVTIPGGWPTLATATGTNGSGGNPQFDGDLPTSLTDPYPPPQNYALTGYTEADNSSAMTIGAVATPEGNIVVAGLSDGYVPSAYRGYALPALRQAWSYDVPAGWAVGIAGISANTMLLTESNGGDTYLLALDPNTGRQKWKTDIGQGNVCDLTSTQVLVTDNNQLAILAASSGEQLSYEPNPYGSLTDGNICPSIVETGLSGVGLDRDNNVVQLLRP
jgi:outer membrane protein assembly factor BamB